MQGKIGLIAVMAAVLLRSAPAWGGPPFLTDDPEPVDLGHGEVYLSSINSWTRAGAAGTLPHIELNYGPLPDVQLHLIAPAAYDRPNDSHAMQFGYGDTELGIKWRPIHEDALFPGCPQIGIFPLAEIPTGDNRLGLGNGKAQFFLPIWLQKSWGEKDHQWILDAGGGYWFNLGPGNRDYWFTGVLLQKQITPQLTLGGELFLSTPSAPGASTVTGFNLGGVYDFSDHWHLLFSAGRDFQGPELFISYFGIQFTY